MGAAIKHPVPDRVKPSFVIFDIQALWRSAGRQRVKYYIDDRPTSRVENFEWRYLRNGFSDLL